MSRGYVYILVNDAMPGLVKIGKTTRDVNARAVEVSNGTGIPLPFKVWDQQLTPDCGELERRVHNEIAQSRINPNREFFEIDAFAASQVVADLHREIVEEFLNHYLPGETLVPAQCFIDPSSIAILANLRGMHETEICRSIEEVRLDDEAISFDELERRYFARLERNNEAQNGCEADSIEGVTLQ